MSVLQEILKWDRECFKVINNQWTNSFFDLLFPFIRNAYFWLPLYLFLLTLVVFNFRRNGWLWVLFAILTAASSDLLSSSVIKEWIYRPRPCNDLNMVGYVRLLAAYCGMNSSFTSSHAVNHFAFAMFVFYTLRKYNLKWTWLLFPWALLVCYAQVYVGVHYPIDVIAGGILGVTIGFAWARFFNHTFNLVSPVVDQYNKN
jgi:membrane-associated phospholipid phosphatase